MSGSRTVLPPKSNTVGCIHVLTRGDNTGSFYGKAINGGRYC